MSVPIPIVFLSYSHDTDAHKEWVLKLATDLMANGVDAELDQWDLVPGQDIVAFMEKGISDSDRVLMICSESYVKKADKGSGGVGYEGLIVTSEVAQNIDTMKFIPLIRNNPSSSKLPRFLGHRLYVDFSNEEQYDTKLQELLRAIHRVKVKPRPGPNPFSTTTAAREDIYTETQSAIYTDPVTGTELVLVKGGCYRMGNVFEADGDGYEDEKPVHEVCVDDFYLGKYEVTVGEFKTFVDEAGYKTEAEKGDGSYIWTDKGWRKDKNANWSNPGFKQDDKHPVVCVSWNDAIAYIEWLSAKTGRKYRLPTEAEWEYAARSGGKDYKYSWGNGTPSGNIADETLKRQFPDWSWPIWEGYESGYIYTAPVGNFMPNEIGIYDMSGNVWEWCQDVYASDAYKKHARNNPIYTGDSASSVIRGGSWYTLPRYVRVFRRGDGARDGRNCYVGFRLAGIK
ncbi:MAG: SUMF1/EgtB/PvdO family nonheme iron enzyme [Nitrospirae bacterium]|nr:SUMF1/EgtB/PvdO family nonheme iron enzyme [Nitrospirota bacterium]